MRCGSIARMSTAASVKGITFKTINALWVSGTPCALLPRGTSCVWGIHWWRGGSTWRSPRSDCRSSPWAWSSRSFQSGWTRRRPDKKTVRRSVETIEMIRIEKHQQKWTSAKGSNPDVSQCLPLRAKSSGRRVQVFKLQSQGAALHTTVNTDDTTLLSPAVETSGGFWTKFFFLHFCLHRDSFLQRYHN